MRKFRTRTKKWKSMRVSVQVYTLCSLPWNLDRDDQSTSRVITQLEMRAVAIQSRESCLRICQTDSPAAPSLKKLVSLNSRSVVFDFNAHDSVSRRSSHFNTTGS